MNMKKRIQSKMKIKLFEEFLNETWYATFKAQGEFIGKKDNVCLEELEKIAWILEHMFNMRNVQCGKIKATPDTSSYTRGETVEKYGVVGTCQGYSNEEFCYYWKQSTSADPELQELESGWVGRAYLKGKSPGQFMSPFEFLECVVMHFFYNDPKREDHLFLIKRSMEKLAMKSPRRGRIMGNKYGLS